MFQDIKNGRFYLGDCLEVMKGIPDGVIDMILCDLPYGTTSCKWDSVIQFNELWEQYKRICKENAAIVLTASQPFTTALISSNIEYFKYCWIWRKNKPQGFLNAKKRPLKDTEDVVVFCYGDMIYNPQNVIKINKKIKNTGTKNKTSFKENGDKTSANNALSKEEYEQEFTNYPRTVIEFANSGNKQIHPTQKPVELFEYLIKTYTNEDELVLDNCAGSGTTAIACENTNRKWICIEQNLEYANKAVERILNHNVEIPLPEVCE